MARAWAALPLVLAVGCGGELDAGTIGSLAERHRGDAVRGKLLYERYECYRCHSDVTPATTRRPTQKTCTACHVTIDLADRDGRFVGLIPGGEPDSSTLARWNRQILHFRHTPTLVGVGRLMRPDWLERFIREPHRVPVKIRPRIGESMPRLDIGERDARDLVAYLGASQSHTPLLSTAAIADYRRDLAPFGRGDPTRGLELYLRKDCGTCHVAAGGTFAHVGDEAPVKPDRGHTLALARAPDLRVTRERFRPEMVVPWLLDPRFHKQDATMPGFELSYAEARHLAAFVMEAPLSPPRPRALPVRLPLLERQVGYDEVSRRVFRKICWHCHASPDYAIGDGGPGMTGGFGIRARGLDLSEYEEIHGGYVGDDGQRRSLFDKLDDGTPVLVASLLSRQLEEIGQTGPVRGMPLAMPSLSPEDIQLVESWVAQGHPR